MSTKRKPPSLPPEFDHKRLRMVCAEPVIGRGRPNSVSTCTFQNAMELVLDQQAMLAPFEEKKEEARRIGGQQATLAHNEISLYGRPIVSRKTFDAYADAAVPAIKLITKLSAGNTVILEDQRSNY